MTTQAAWPFPTSAQKLSAERPSLVLARIILRAFDLYEGAYDHVASDAAQREYLTKVEKDRADGAGISDDEAEFFGPDYDQFHRESLMACCWLAVSTE